MVGYCSRILFKFRFTIHFKPFNKGYVNILKKQRQQVSGCVAELVAERADSVPKVFTGIHLHFIVKGNDLRAEKVSRAVKLSAEKYCSASIMLTRGGVSVTHDFDIIEDSK